METITIAVIAGTSRGARESIKAARWVAEQFKQHEGVEVVFVDPAEHVIPHDGDNEHDSVYADITARADAFYVVTPEYNHSFPGSLKRLLDSEFDSYMHKPVGTAGVSSGPWGGVRVCEALLPVYHRVGLVTILPEMYFPKVQDLFDEQGGLKPEHQEMYTKNVAKVLDELLWMARVLKQARQA